MREEAEMEEEVESEESMDESGEGEEEMSREDFMEFLVKQTNSAEEFEDALEKYGFELVKKEEKPEDMKASFGDIEEELGMNMRPPKISVVRIAAARNALGKAGKRK